MPSARQLAYQLYLESDHWKQLRAVVLARDGNKCTRCPAVSALQAHHTLYRTRFEDSLPEDLVTLCRGCHRKEHGIGRKSAPPIRRAEIQGYVPDTDAYHLNWQQLVAARAARKISRQQFLYAKAKMFGKDPANTVVLKRCRVRKKKKYKYKKALTNKEWKIRNKYAGWAETAFRVQ